MSKKVKMALGVAAAIAMPFYVPAIVGTGGLGLTGMSSVLGGAAVGAAGGALSANLTGGDWRKGAALGALGGGFAGYAPAPTVPSEPLAGLGGGVPPPSSTLPTSPMPGLGGGPVPTGPAPLPGLGGAPTLPPSVTDTTGFLAQTAAPTLEGATAGGTAALPQSVTDTSGFLSRSAQATAATPPPTGGGFFSGVSETLGGPSVYVPAGISLASGYMGEKKAEEAQAAQEAEIRRQQQQQEAVFARKQALAESLAQQAEAVNPEYFGLQSARRAQAAGAMATRAAEEATPFYKPGLRMAEKRRGELATARTTGTAYDVGYGTGVEAKRGLTESAIRSMPEAPMSGLASYYGTQAAGQRQAGMDVGGLFGDIYSRYDQAQQRRLEERRLAALEDELRRQRGSV